MRKRKSVAVDASAWLRTEIRSGRLAPSLNADQLRGVAAIVKSCDRTLVMDQSNGRDRAGISVTTKKEDGRGRARQT